MNIISNMIIFCFPVLVLAQQTGQVPYFRYGIAGCVAVVFTVFVIYATITCVKKCRKKRELITLKKEENLVEIPKTVEQP